MSGDVCLIGVFENKNERTSVNYFNFNVRFFSFYNFFFKKKKRKKEEEPKQSAESLKWSEEKDEWYKDVRCGCFVF